MGAVLNKVAQKQNRQEGDKLAAFDDVMKEACLSMDGGCPHNQASGYGCPLLDLLNTDAFELILDKLSLRDVVALMLTSKAVKEMVYQYKKAKQFRWFTMLVEFRKHNLMTMTKPEMDAYLKHKLRYGYGVPRSSEVQLALDRQVRSQECLVRYKSVRSILDNSGRIRRQHVYDAEHFPRLSNPNYVGRTFNKELARDVVELKSVCGLHFRLYFRVAIQQEIACLKVGSETALPL